jgi:hypothetical protein
MVCTWPFVLGRLYLAVCTWPFVLGRLYLAVCRAGGRVLVQGGASAAGVAPGASEWNDLRWCG